MARLLKKLKAQIDSADIISFDIFDTLLIRPYLRPTDLFLHLEKIYKIPFFCSSRIEAEKQARMHHPEREDITFDMIYNELKEPFKILKSKELELEKNVLRANPEMLDVYNYAVQAHKKIIIVSDMYLPSDFLQTILRQQHIDKWCKFYVSGELNKSKASGSVFKQIINDFSMIPPHKMLHIGDNKVSDSITPQKVNIKTYLYQPITKQFLQQNKRAKQYIKQDKFSLGRSILISVLAEFWYNQQYSENPANYWQKLGYAYAGPTAYAYCRFIEKQTEKLQLNNLLFIARDGYLLQKIFTLFNNTIKTAYVYAPRLFNQTCCLAYNQYDAKQTSAVIKFFGDKIPELKNEISKLSFSDAQENYQFIKAHQKLLIPFAKKKFENYKKYLQQYVTPGDRCGIVDTITSEFSSQRLLQNALQNQPLQGLYWGVIELQMQDIFSYQAFATNYAAPHNNSKVFTKNWNFIEFLITSPEHSIKDLTEQGKPIYDASPSPFEIKRATQYDYIAQYGLQFALDIQSRFDGADIYLTSKAIIDWINIFIDCPYKEDVQNMMNIRVGTDSAHKIYEPLFVAQYSWKDMIKNFSQVKKTLTQNLWLTARQKFFLCFCHPLSIRTHGLSRIDIKVLQHLPKQYFHFKLQFSEKCYYSITLGCNKD